MGWVGVCWWGVGTIIFGQRPPMSSNETLVRFVIYIANLLVCVCVGGGGGGARSPLYPPLMN